MVDLFSANAPSFLSLLPSGVAASLTQAATRVHYTDGQLIQTRGDAKPGLSVVQSGAVKAGIHGADGVFAMAFILGPGQTFGEFTLYAGLPRTHDMTAMGPTSIDHISANRFMALYDGEPAISRAMLSTALIRSHLLLEILDAMRRLPMRERTAKILLTLMQSAGTPDAFKCRQSDLAFTLGVSRMSLSTALKQLAALGLVETGYGEVRLPEPDRMADWVARKCE